MHFFGANRATTVAVVLLALNPVPPLAHAKTAPLTKQLIELQTEYGPLILQNVTLEQSGLLVHVTGTVTNNSSRAWRFISFKLVLRDKSGRDVAEPHPVLLPELGVNNLGKGETKPIAGVFGSGPTTFSVSVRHKVEDFDVQWVKDSSYYDSHPIFSLTKPLSSRTLDYEDDAIRITFNVANEQLEFTLSNKTQEPLSINWDEVSYVDLSGTAHRVLHKGVKLVDRDKPQSATTIPPGARIDDLIEPSDSVQWSSSISDWMHVPLLPPSQSIVEYKGKTFGAFLPIVIDGKKKNYTFTIRIDDVEM